MTKTIAITGGIGSGKSTFCSKLKEKGFKIHSSDEQVSKIYKNPEKKFVTYLRTIGLSKSISKKNIDKKIISKIIFENKQIRKKLELYIFKIVRKKRSDFIKQEKQKKTKLIFIDIPLLFENNLEKQFNKVISIIATKGVRFKRLKKPYIIAEIGGNHCADINLAKKGIFNAKKAGADCVKFQMYRHDTIVHPRLQLLPHVKSIAKEKTQSDRFKKLELSENNIIDLRKTALKPFYEDL